MLDFIKERFDYVLRITIIILIILSILASLGISFADKPVIVRKIVTIEAFDKTKMNDYANGLCDKYASNPQQIEQTCNKLTKDNCKVPSCCGWLNDNKCVAGNKSGPTYLLKKNELKSWQWREEPAIVK
jgi:hypothetical protein